MRAELDELQIPGRTHGTHTHTHTEASPVSVCGKPQVRCVRLASSGPGHGKIPRFQHYYEYRKLMGTDFFSRSFATVKF